MEILINSQHACVHYFCNDQGDMWQSMHVLIELSS